MSLPLVSVAVPAYNHAPFLTDCLESVWAQTYPRLELVVVDEYRTTELAKGEYWKAHPPTGWRRLLPVTMQVPPVPVDDFVAVLLGRRYIQGKA